MTDMLKELRLKQEIFTAQIQALEDLHEWNENQGAAYENASAEWHNLQWQIEDLKRQAN